MGVLILTETIIFLGLFLYFTNSLGHYLRAKISAKSLALNDNNMIEKHKSWIVASY